MSATLSFYFHCTWIWLIFGAQVGKKAGERVTVEGIEVALNPEELDLDTAAMQAKYEQTVREQQSQLEKEDLSDMVAAHAAKQQKVVARFCQSWKYFCHVSDSKQWVSLAVLWLNPGSYLTFLFFV